MAKLVIAPPCHGGDRRFESVLGRWGILAQLGEHLPYKQGVTGSSPVGPIVGRAEVQSGVRSVLKSEYADVAQF